MQTSELKFFKTMLEERKVQLLKNISAVHQEMVQLGGCELNDEADYSATNNHLRLDSTLSLRQGEELREIENALAKMTSGSSKNYGSCEMCDDDIGFARLKVKPHALYCIVCRGELEKKVHLHK